MSGRGGRVRARDRQTGTASSPAGAQAQSQPVVSNASAANLAGAAATGDFAELARAMRARAVRAEAAQQIVKDTVSTGAAFLDALDAHYAALTARYEVAFSTHEQTIEVARKRAETRAAILNFALGVLVGAAVGPVAGVIANRLTTAVVGASTSVIRSTATELTSSLLSSSAGEGAKALGLEVSAPENLATGFFNADHARIRALSNANRLNQSFRSTAVILAQDPNVPYLYQQLALAIALGEVDPLDVAARQRAIERLDTAVTGQAMEMLLIQANFTLLGGMLAAITIPRVRELEQDIWIVWIAQLPGGLLEYMESPETMSPEKAIDRGAWSYAEGARGGHDSPLNRAMEYHNAMRQRLGILDEDPIEDRLHDIGVLGGEKSRLKHDFGRWTSYADERTAWGNALRKLPDVRAKWAVIFFD
jgi:hypothetical protein